MPTLLNFTFLTARIKTDPLVFILCFRCKCEVVLCFGNSPQKGSIRTTTGTAVGSEPRTATTFCSTFTSATLDNTNLKFFPSSFFLISVRLDRRVHYSVVKAETSRESGGGRHVQPLVSVTRAIRPSGEKPCIQEEGKSLRARMRRKSELIVQRTLLHGCDIIKPPGLALNEPSLLV